MPAPAPEFRTLGGARQPVFDTPESLETLALIDPARWAAVSAPVDAFLCDPVFLRFLDSDRNGRIRSDEVLAACAWCLRMLRDRSGMRAPTETLCLDAIDDSHPAGAAIALAARRVLSNLGRADDVIITLADIRNRQSIVAAGCCNGDGVIPPGSAGEKEVADLVRLVMDAIGSQPDAGGQAGVTEEHLDRFLAETRAYLAWLDAGMQLDAGGALPAGMDRAATAEAFNRFTVVREKVDAHFALCRLMRLSPARVVTVAGEGMALPQDATAREMDEALARARLAEPDPGMLLALDGPLNPAWEEPLNAFFSALPGPLLPWRPGDARQLSAADWRRLTEAFAPYAAWLAARPDTRVDAAGEAALREFADSYAPARLRALMETDRAVAAELDDIGQVERLILCQRWLLEWVNNFASLPRLFDPAVRSLIEQGTLILDGRHFNLCVRVSDRATHRTVAQRSDICVLYVECTAGTVDAPRRETIAAAVTAGTMTRLYVGKYGVFLDGHGTAWDARVVDIIENPVSFAEALRMPFVRLGAFVAEQLERFGMARQKALEEGLGKSIAAAETRISDKPPSAVPAPAGGLQSIVLSGSVAVAALGSAFAFITQSLADVPPWKVLTVAFGILCVLMGPTVVMTLLRLRRRNLSLFLEAGGWSVNAAMRLSHALGRLFTREPLLPEGEVVPLAGAGWLGAEARRAPRVLTYALAILIAVLGFRVGGALCRHFGWDGKILRALGLAENAPLPRPAGVFPTPKPPYAVDAEHASASSEAPLSAKDPVRPDAPAPPTGPTVPTAPATPVTSSVPITTPVPIMRTEALPEPDLAP